jgi:GxxExxY protein
VPINVSYKGKIVGEYFADIVVEGKVNLELKAQEKITGAHEAQILNYLKASGIKVGLLVNFYHPKATIKRFVF